MCFSLLFSEGLWTPDHLFYCRVRIIYIGVGANGLWWRGGKKREKKKQNKSRHRCGGVTGGASELAGSRVYSRASMGFLEITTRGGLAVKGEGAFLLQELFWESGGKHLSDQ